jgi:cytochrome bd ubiquinol oxidase subunit II
MATLWFCIVAVMLAAYVILDGFDIGTGAIHLFAAKSDDERRKVLRSIGPVWDGNEVWLLATGGALYFAFPQLYASSFSGFYLPLIMVLWMLMGRAIGLEFRSHIEGPVWKKLCDSVFAVSSILLAIFYGAALGNVVRGVPLAADHYFFLPLWTNWRVGPNPGILDWYTVLSGVVALVALSLHGAHWVALKTDGDLQQRVRKASLILSPALLVLTLLSLIATLSIRPEVLRNFKLAPIGYIIPLAVFGSVVLMFLFTRRGNDKGAFLASSTYLTMMLVGVAFALYPIILPASTGEQFNLTIANSVTSAYAMKVALVWWTFGIIIALGYFVYVYRMFKGKVSLTGSGEHGY